MGLPHKQRWFHLGWFLDLKHSHQGEAAGKKIRSFSALTSICHVELDPKVSTGASGVVTGCEDDPAYGLDLPDDAGNSRRGQEAIVADYQTTNLHSTDAMSVVHESRIKAFVYVFISALSVSRCCVNLK